MSHKNFTRGRGLLENFLAHQRFLVADRLIAKEHRQGRILDIGCGVVPYFLLQTQFNEKHGLDPYIKDEQVKQFAHKISFHKIFITKETLLPLENQSFFAVTMLGVVEHFNQESFICLLKEIKRILKSEGVFILTTPSPWTRWLLKLMAKLYLISREEIEGIMESYSQNKIKDCLTSAGFDIKKMRFAHFQMFLNSWMVVEK